MVALVYNSSSPRVRNSIHIYFAEYAEFTNYVIPLIKVVFGCMCAKEGAFAAMMIQTP